MNRRNFLTAFSSDLAASVAAAQPSTGANKPLRVGFIGVGGRGSYHLTTCLELPGIEVKALCDINPNYLYRAKRYVEEAKQPAPALYGKDRTDWMRLIERDDLDVVITATPWQWHTPICVAAMKAGKHAATEVPAAVTVDECWELVETSEKTGKQMMMTEQVNYIRELLAILRMAQTGALGDILHAAGGYVHDLRLVKFDPAREPWRLQWEYGHNGNLYPTHPIGPIAWWLNINRGDRFDYLVSLSTKSRVIREYADLYYGEQHPYSTAPTTQGDVNTSLLRTVGGKTVTLHYDTNTPHPHTGEFRLQGTKGLFAGNLRSVYLEGRSPKSSEWQLFSPELQKEFDHPLWATLDQSKLKSGKGHGGGIDTTLMWARWFNALRTGSVPDMTATDAATWSAIFPLSEKSVAAKSRPVDFPDFTKGKWKSTPPVTLA
jgi:predicted dehydrogenase